MEAVLAAGRVLVWAEAGIGTAAHLLDRCQTLAGVIDTPAGIVDMIADMVVGIAGVVVDLPAA